MLRKNVLLELMQEEPPSISYQKRLGYRTDIHEVTYLYRLINKVIFKNALEMPEIEVVPRCRKYWGMCYASWDRLPGRRSYCKIRLMDKWYSHHWLISTLAHEMCHQYQWDVQGAQRRIQGKNPIMSHGPSFFVFRDKLKKHGIPLKSAHSKRKWFKTQDLFKT